MFFFFLITLAVCNKKSHQLHSASAYTADFEEKRQQKVKSIKLILSQTTENN